MSQESIKEKRVKCLSQYGLFHEKYEDVNDEHKCILPFPPRIHNSIKMSDNCN